MAENYPKIAALNYPNNMIKMQGSLGRVSNVLWLICVGFKGGYKAANEVCVMAIWQPQNSCKKSDFKINKDHAKLPMKYNNLTQQILQ